MMTLTITVMLVTAGVLCLKMVLRHLDCRCRDERAQLLAGMDNLELGVVLFTDKQEIAFCNRRYRDIYGLTSEQVKPGTPIAALRRRLAEMGLMVSGRSELESTDSICELADGRIIAFTVRPVPSGGWISTHEDVTDREALNRRLKEQYKIVSEQQEQLKARNLQFDSALNHMSEALCFFDADQRLIVCNDRYAEMYGIGPDLMRPGMTLRDIIDLRYQAGSLPAMSSGDFYALRNSVLAANAAADSIVKQTNGRTFAIHHRPMPNGGWIATHSDITEREELHSQLTEQLEIVNEQKLLLATRNFQFDTALNNISQGLCFFDGTEKLLVCNNRYIEMYDLVPQSVVPGMTLGEIVNLRYEMGSSPVMSKDEYHGWRNAVAGLDTASDTVVELVNGRMIRLHHQPMPDGGWVATHEDITQQRQVEKERRLTVDRLHTAQAELTRAVAAAEASNEAKSSFLANMSHEIRTPLNGILGMAQVLANEPLTEPQQESVKTILESGQTLMALLNDVLDLSKIEAGKLDIVPIDAEIENVFTHLRKLFLARASEKSITLTVEIDPSIPKLLRFDYVRVHQCVANLIANAVKFTQAGGVKITVAHEETGAGEHRISVAIADTGIGIGKDAAARLFSEFSQADASTTRQFGGTGLGLAITRKLARMMGGDVALSSWLGEGSTFTLSFCAFAATSPCASVPAAAREIRTPAASLHGLKILLVDDNATNRSVARLLLAPSGVAVTEATNGMEALQRLAENDFDLVLLDVHMPVMDGTQTIRCIRTADTPWRHIPVIALTADAMNGDRERLLSIGMSGYASKPIEQRALLHEIHRVLGDAAGDLRDDGARRRLG